MTEKILVPVLGESITEATVSKWLKSKGDNISADEPIVELETDKVNLEVPSPINGKLTAINFKDGDTVEVGAVLGEISEGPSDQKQEDNKNFEKPKNKTSDNVINFEKEKKQDLKITKFKRKGIYLIKSKIDRNNRFDIKLILKKLHNYGCRNLLIEGGDKLTNSLIKNKIFNKFYLYKSPKNLSKNFEYLKFSSQNILNQKYKTKINLNLNLRKDRITLYS